MAEKLINYFKEACEATNTNFDDLVKDYFYINARVYDNNWHKEQGIEAAGYEATKARFDRMFKIFDRESSEIESFLKDDNEKFTVSELLYNKQPIGDEMYQEVISVYRLQFMGDALGTLISIKVINDFNGVLDFITRFKITDVYPYN